MAEIPFQHFYVETLYSFHIQIFGGKWRVFNVCVCVCVCVCFKGATFSVEGGQSKGQRGSATLRSPLFPPPLRNSLCTVSLLPMIRYQHACYRPSLSATAAAGGAVCFFGSILVNSISLERLETNFFKLEVNTSTRGWTDFDAIGQVHNDFAKHIKFRSAICCCCVFYSVNHCNTIQY